jgi:hypothetical protein
MLTPPDKEHFEQSVTSARGHVSKLLCDNFFQQQLETHMQISIDDVSSDHDDAVSKHINDDVSTDWGDDGDHLNRGDTESSHEDCLAGTITPHLHRCRIAATPSAYTLSCISLQPAAVSVRHTQSAYNADWLARETRSLTFDSGCDSDRTFATTATAGSGAKNSFDDELPESSSISCKMSSKYRHVCMHCVKSFTCCTYIALLQFNLLPVDTASIYTLWCDVNTHMNTNHHSRCASSNMKPPADELFKDVIRGNVGTL